MQFVEYFHLMLSFLPPWFEIAIGLLIVALIVVALCRLVAFIWDILPIA